jgi:tyrosyl-tRNA synthetase
MADEIQERANRIRSVGIENIGDEGLEALLTNKPEIVAYDGFEPSGRMHIAQGLIRAINTNKMTSSGVTFKFWVADWFATMNLKMGGDNSAIRKAGELMIHTWRACGMDLDNVEFVWASEEIARRPAEYFSLVLDIATKNSVKRILKCGQIMGRKEFDDDGEAKDISMDDIVGSLKSSQVFYPVMQCADIFFLGVDICSLGLDQRKVNMLALEYCDKIKRRFKPIIISHAMLMGLDGSDKMSKSNPDSAIFMDDTEQEVNRKIKKAYCKPGQIDVNPILEYFKHIVFEIEEGPIQVFRVDYETKVETLVEYNTFEALEEAFSSEYIYPNDLKKSLKFYLNKYLEPVRTYFAENAEARKLSADVKRISAKVAKQKAKAKAAKAAKADDVDS